MSLVGPDTHSGELQAAECPVAERGGMSGSGIH